MHFLLLGPERLLDSFFWTIVKKLFASWLTFVLSSGLYVISQFCLVVVMKCPSLAFNNRKYLRYDQLQFHFRDQGTLSLDFVVGEGKVWCTRHQGVSSKVLGDLPSSLSIKL